MNEIRLEIAQPGFDDGDAFAGFDGGGAGHGADDGLTAGPFAWGRLGGHGKGVCGFWPFYLRRVLIGSVREVERLCARTHPRALGRDTTRHALFLPLLMIEPQP